MIFLLGISAFFAVTALPSTMANGITNLADVPCGKTLVKSSISSRQSRIVVEGGETRPGEIPWNVFIRLDTNDSPTPSIFCGGIILNRNYILTTAHCLVGIPKNQKLRVAVGKHNVRRRERHSYEVTVKEIIIHKGYVFQGIPEHKDDIALLRLEKPLQWTDYVRPACLPSKSFSADGLEGTISGWGISGWQGQASAQLLKAKVPIMTNQECEDWFSTNLQRDNNPFLFRPLESHLCAYKQGEADACQGDSGGGISVQNGDVQTVVGLIVSGYECAISPGLYTRITSYLDWIKSEISKRKPDRYSPVKQNHPLRGKPFRFPRPRP